MGRAGRSRSQGDPSQPVPRDFSAARWPSIWIASIRPSEFCIRCGAKPGVAKGPLERGREHEAFERISWDEALDAIAARLQQISDEFGPESILPYSYAGTMGVLGYGSMDRRFFHRLGGSQLDRTICAEAGGEAWNLVYGKKLGTPTEDFKLAKLIIAWGATFTATTSTCGRWSSRRGAMARG